MTTATPTPEALLAAYAEEHGVTIVELPIEEKRFNAFIARLTDGRIILALPEGHDPAYSLRITPELVERVTA
jgi:hypothetical protein